MPEQGCSGYGFHPFVGAPEVRAFSYVLLLRSGRSHFGVLSAGSDRASQSQAAL